MLRRFCQASFAKLKSLEFGNGRYDGSGALSDFTPSILKSKLDVCAESLERVKFVGSDKEGAELLTTFSKHYFPRLTELEVHGHWIKDEELFRVIVEKNPSLRQLKWMTDESPVFPKGTYPNLESVQFGHCRTDGIVSMTGALPNLKSLHIDTVRARDPVIDVFLQSVPRLEVFYMRGPYHKNLEYFWWLSSLKDATFIPPETDGLQLDDEDALKISTSFRQLQNLKIIDSHQISSPGIVALGSLKELRKLELTSHLIDSSSTDTKNAFKYFTDCKHLEIFRVDFDVHLSTIIGLIRNSPNLREVSIQDLLGADRPGAIAAELLSLVDVGKRNVDVKFSLDTLQNEIWKSDPVKAAVEKLKDEGIEIKITYGDPVKPFYWELFTTGGGSESKQLRLELCDMEEKRGLFYR